MVLFSFQTSYAQQDTTLANFDILIEPCGFIPFNSSYRINYESNLIGLPVELAAGIDFPLNHSVATALMLRYRKRTALYVEDLSVSTLEIEPGIRAYLEKSHPHDLRLLGTASLLLARSTVRGTLSASKDGAVFHPLAVSKDYYNIGLSLGLGVEYDLTSISSIYSELHVGIYMADPVRLGGLGNAGGLSIGIGYKYAIF